MGYIGYGTGLGRTCGPIGCGNFGGCCGGPGYGGRFGGYGFGPRFNACVGCFGGCAGWPNGPTYGLGYGGFGNGVAGPLGPRRIAGLYGGRGGLYASNFNVFGVTDWGT